MNFSISKNNFSSVLSNSKIFFSSDLKIYYILNNKKKIGFMVSKTFGSAPQRNLLKRRCRAIFLNHKKIKLTIIIKPLKSNNIKHNNLLLSFNNFSSFLS